MIPAKPKNARPGNDSLPDQAWSAAGAAGISILMAVDAEMRRDVLPTDEDCRHFNDSGIAFLPKGSNEQDLVESSRGAMETRPISSKSSDNKTVMAANIAALTPA